MIFRLILFSIWPLLKWRNTDLVKPLRLFDANMSRSFLCCCESWTLTAQDKRRLQTTERAMLRRFAGPRRRPQEEYVDWMRRATYSAEDERAKAGIASWVVAASRKKWMWAGHVTRMSEHRWASRLTSWRDSVWWSDQDQRTSAPRPLRSRAGHFTRWEAEVCKFASSLEWGHWKLKARSMSTEDWNSFREPFAAAACKSLRRRVD